MTLIDQNTARLSTFVRYARSGHLPTSGGMLDQTRAFGQAMTLIEAEQASYKAKVEA